MECYAKGAGQYDLFSRKEGYKVDILQEMQD